MTSSGVRPRTSFQPTMNVPSHTETAPRAAFITRIQSRQSGATRWASTLMAPRAQYRPVTPSKNWA
jgi:hypothetical protein